MKEYLFNENGFCINPDTCTFKLNDFYYFSFSTAFFKTKWYFGYIVHVYNDVSSCNVYNSGISSDTQNEAVSKAKTVILNILLNNFNKSITAPEKINIKKLVSLMPTMQLELIDVISGDKML